MSENVGHDMIFKILKNDAQKIFCQSNLCPGDDPFTRNIRANPETTPTFVKSRQDTFVDNDSVYTSPSTILDNGKYQDDSFAHDIETSEIVSRFFFVSTSEDSIVFV